MNRDGLFSPTLSHPLLDSSPDYAARNDSFRRRSAVGNGRFHRKGSFGVPWSLRERSKKLKEADDEMH